MTTFAFFAASAMSTTAPAMNFAVGFCVITFITRLLHAGKSSPGVLPPELMSFVPSLTRTKSTSPAWSRKFSMASIVPPPPPEMRRCPPMPEWLIHSSGIAAPQMSALWS